LALRHLVAYFDGHVLLLLDGKKEKGEGLWARGRRAINARRVSLTLYAENEAT
jgi:hypothetical protein